MFVMTPMQEHDGRVELQQLRYVVALAQERSFTRAAERCFVVQSALSHQVKALERELGVVLFARTSRRVEVTPAGEAFLVGARASLEAAERAVADAAATLGEVRGSLGLGVIPTVTAIDVPRTLARFHQEHPSVAVRLRGGGSDEFVTAIAAGNLDVAILGLADSAPPRGVAVRELKRERLVAVLPADHRLAGRRRLGLGDLADERFIDFPAGRPGREQSDLAFASAGLQREVAFEATAIDLMLGLIEQSLGVALLSPGVVPPGSGCTCVPVTDGPVRVEYLAWSDFNPSPAAQAFLGILGMDEPVAGR